MNSGSGDPNSRFHSPFRVKMTPVESLEANLARVIEASDRAYGLLVWLGDLVDANKLSVNDARRVLGSPQGARSFLKRQAASLPSELTPMDEESERQTANVLGSYLSVSFDLLDERQDIRVPDPVCGPSCPWCWHVTKGPHLKTKKLSGSDKRRAETASRNGLQELVGKEGMTLDEDALARLLSECREESAALAYAKDLVDRADGYHHGKTGLALWRMFAWHGGSPRKGFRFDVEFVEGARQTVVDHLDAMNSGISRPH